MSSVPTPDALIESFPNPVIPKIEGIPTYESIANVRALLSANAAAVSSLRGGGNNGYLGIVLSDAVYTTVSGIPWVSPNFPGATHTHDTSGSHCCADRRGRPTTCGDFERVERIYQHASGA